MASNTISIGFKIDTGANGLKQLTIDADGLRTAMAGVVTQAEGLSAKFKDRMNLGFVLEQARNAFSELQSIIGDFTGAYTAQIQAETQLANNMRNTMDATDAQIDAIKRLCAAQQELGVIGDEVQLAGAQELATYLETTDALESLIPVMNDMLAQQYGLNASQESAAQIAAMLGKVMDGQVNALSRYGYKFDDAQKAVLTYGTEAERAATLVDVISSSVGGMNESLAQTDAGKMKQLENAAGDTKESIGALVQSFAPFIKIGAEFGIILTSFTKLVVTVKTLGSTLLGSVNITKILVLALRASGLSASQARGQIAAFAMATSLGAKAMAALKIAIRSILAATGIGLLVTLVSELASAFIDASSSADNFTNSCNKVESALDRLNKAHEDSDAELKKEEASIAAQNTLMQINIKRLSEFNGSKAEEKKLVKEMNDTYGDTMGYFSSVSGWYKALVADSEAYTKQMMLEAKIRASTNKITANQEIINSADDLQKDYDWGVKYLESLRDKKKNSSVAGPYDPRLGWHNLSKDKVTGAYDVNYVLEQALAGVDLSVDDSTIKGDGLVRDLVNAPTVVKAIKAIVKGRDVAQARQNAIDSNSTLENQIEDYAKELSGISFDVTGSPTRPDGSDVTSAQKTLLQQLNEQIEAAKENYIKLNNDNDPEKKQRDAIHQTILALIAKKDAIEQARKESELPFKNDNNQYNSIAEYDAIISHLESLRSKASATRVQELEKEIKALKKQKEELFGQKPLELDKIKTYSQLNYAIQYYESQLTEAEESARVEILETIRVLNSMKSKWDEIKSDATYTPPKLAGLTTLDEYEKAIAHYRKLQGEASAGEYYVLQKTIDGLNTKIALFKRADDISQKLSERDLFGQLSNKELTIKIKSIGFEELTNRINELKLLFNDNSNPLTENQKKDVESLIKTYEKWRIKSIDTFGSLKDGWGGVKGLSSGVDSLTESIKGNGNAWQRITKAIDGFISVSESIAQIVKVVKMLTMATQLQSIATESETIAKQNDANATQEQMNALTPLIFAKLGEFIGTKKASEASKENATSKIEETTAVQTETTAEVQNAASKLFSAHSWIPWVGVGLAAAMVGVMIAQMSSMPKFAEGGIVSGPTIGLMGEYSGATNNPEVVAPLSKLRDLIEPAGVSGKVEFVIDGRVIRGILKKEERHNHRMG